MAPKKRRKNIADSLQTERVINNSCKARHELPLMTESIPHGILSMATVVLKPAAAAELDGINNPIHDRVLRLLEKLQRWPDVSGAKPLRGELAGRYRLRTGDYRLQFYVVGTAPNERVVVELIGHRDGFYEE